MSRTHLLVLPDMSTEKLDEPFIVIRCGAHGACVDWYGFEQELTGVICNDLEGALRTAGEVTPVQRRDPPVTTAATGGGS